jgi:ABC-type glycerol-3-phosphate transport system substrate-binding protein
MKRSVLSALVLALVFCLATAGAVSAATKVTLWTFIPQHARFFDVMAEKWNAQHPDRQIELESSVLPYDDMHNNCRSLCSLVLGRRISVILRSAVSPTS